MRLSSTLDARGGAPAFGCDLRPFAGEGEEEEEERSSAFR